MSSKKTSEEESNCSICLLSTCTCEQTTTTMDLSTFSWLSPVYPKCFTTIHPFVSFRSHDLLLWPRHSQWLWCGPPLLYTILWQEQCLWAKPNACLWATFISIHCRCCRLGWTSAINNWLASLHFWHTLNAMPWNGKEMLIQTKKSAQKLIPISSEHAKCPPTTIEHLYALWNGLNLTNSFDAMVWAIACIAFWCCCCLGELVIPSTNTFDPLKHANHSE